MAPLSYCSCTASSGVIQMKYEIFIYCINLEVESRHPQIQPYRLLGTNDVYESVKKSWQFIFCHENSHILEEAEGIWKFFLVFYVHSSGSLVTYQIMCYVTSFGVCLGLVINQSTKPLLDPMWFPLSLY